jgi:hypothetical protein
MCWWESKELHLVEFKYCKHWYNCFVCSHTYGFLYTLSTGNETPPYNLCLFNFRTRFQKRLMHESRGLPVKGKEVMKRKHISLYSCSKKITLIFSFFSDYLGNVLEDLGLSLSEHLQQVSTLLRLSPQEYQSKSSGCSPRLVAAVRQMRNITSSGWIKDDLRVVYVS